MEQDEAMDSLLCETPTLLPTLSLTLPPQAPEGTAAGAGAGPSTAAPAAAPTAVSSHNLGKGIKVGRVLKTCEKCEFFGDLIPSNPF